MNINTSVLIMSLAMHKQCVTLPVLLYGRYLLLATMMPQFLVMNPTNFLSVYCNFSFLKPVSKSTVLLSISVIVTNSRLTAEMCSA
jgi:hypothetical protein